MGLQRRRRGHYFLVRHAFLILFFREIEGVGRCKGLRHYYLGIDPGKQGGLALINDDLEVIALELMPQSGYEFYRWLERLNYRHELVVTLERVHSMKGQGSQATFTFGQQLGKCETVLDILVNLRLSSSLSTTSLVPTPQEWMKAIPQIQRKVNDFKTKTLWKRYLGSVAKELFPKAVIWTNSWWNKGRTDAVSDAMLIAYYGWLTNH